MIASCAENWRLLIVSIDESVAAYALCLQDGSVMRLWDNRVAPDWLRYSAGLIATVEVLRRAVAGPFDVVSWGCGEQRYKTSMATDMVPTVDANAWSSRLCRDALATRRAVRSRVAARLRGRHHNV